jgi:hypothetical protein
VTLAPIVQVSLARKFLYIVLIKGLNLKDFRQYVVSMEGLIAYIVHELLVLEVEVPVGLVILL